MFVDQSLIYQGVAFLKSSKVMPAFCAMGIQQVSAVGALPESQ
jgi:hypothetical protein